MQFARPVHLTDNQSIVLHEATKFVTPVVPQVVKYMLML